MFLSLFSILCTLRFCNVLCIVSFYVYSFLFFIYVQFYRPLPQGGNPIAISKLSYHIISKKTIKNRIKLVYIKINGFGVAGYVMQKQVEYHDVSRCNGGSAV
jgi:hypothetical protein